MRGKTTADIRNELILSRCNSSYNQIVVHSGSNSIPSKKPKIVADELIKLAREVKLNMPNSKLYISAIIPKIDEKFLPGIDEINHRLYAASSKLNFDFIQHPQFVFNSEIDHTMFSFREQQPDWTKGMVHLSRKGVAQLATNIKYMIKTKQ